jgi:hypothetical protein
MNINPTSPSQQKPSVPKDEKNENKNLFGFGFNFSKNNLKNNVKNPEKNNENIYDIKRIQNKQYENNLILRFNALFSSILDMINWNMDDSTIILDNNTRNNDLLYLIKNIQSYITVLKPYVTSLCTAKTAENMLIIYNDFMKYLPHRVFRVNSAEDVVLTYVLLELFYDLYVWCNTDIETTNTDDDNDDSNNDNKNNKNIRKLSVKITKKIIFLKLDECGLNSVLSTLCEKIIQNIKYINDEHINSVGKNDSGFVNELLRKNDDTQKITDLNEIPCFYMSGICVANCLLSESQIELYDVYILSLVYKYYPPNLDSDDVYLDNENINDIKMKKKELFVLGDMLIPSVSIFIYIYIYI